jgi:hypothetical protein
MSRNFIAIFNFDVCITVAEVNKGIIIINPKRMKKEYNNGLLGYLVRTTF